ncbi:TonB-dependent receptor plug domain-containing protein [Shewanella youngdeokensis]|uniref:TonB-dependent receptor n=1 Tax=Shewanella youngdeokensis TaxID=2999068 RepID=A0ABZ0K2R7_9GAMM|nr:TonB-dependent receptor [Shewanella sp. DAU334]
MKTYAPLLMVPLCMTPLVHAQSIEVMQIEGRLDETLSLKQAENGVAMVTIGREQIDQAGTADLNGILQQFVPELTALSKNGRYDYASYSLQGSRSQDILWLIDGIRINNRLFGGGYLDSISTAMIDRIEVLQAGQGVMYGTDALAGVVNIITRSYKGTDEGQIGVGIDTLGSTQLHGYASSLVGEVELTVFGASDQSDGYSPWKDSDYHWTATDRERGYDVQNLGAKIAWDNSNTQISVMAQYNQADLDYMRSYYNVETQNRREQTLLTLSIDSQLTDTTQAIIKAYHHSWDTDYFRLYQYEDGSIDLRNNNDYWGFEDTGVKAWFEGNAGQHLWSLGAEYQQYKGSDVTMGFETDTERVTDVFGQFKPRFESIPHLNSAVGLRYSTISDGEDALIGELSAKYTINNAWKLRLSGGNSFRLPTAENLYATENTMGNRDLTPEKGQNINTGFQYTNDDISIDTNFYWRSITDLIGSSQTADGQWQYVNVDKEVNTLGLGSSIDWSINQQLSTQLSATYNEINDKNDEQTLLNIPEVTANWHLAFDHSKYDYGIWSHVSYIGNMEAYDIEYGNYALVDIGIYYNFGNQEQHRLQLKIENLFDTDTKTGVTLPYSDAPADYTDAIFTYGIERNAQLSYQYNF